MITIRLASKNKRNTITVTGKEAILSERDAYIILHKAFLLAHNTYPDSNSIKVDRIKENHYIVSCTSSAGLQAETGE